MPQKGDTQINNFVGGLITEASPLNFPPNASQDEINFKLLRDGTRERRLGIDFEDGYTLHSTGFTTAQIQQSKQTFFHWPKPSGSTKVSIGIIQIGGALFFIDLWKEAPSSNLLNGGSSVDSGLRGNVNLSFSLINNNVVVVSEALPTPFVLSYNDVTDTVTATAKTIEIRDLYGVDDGLAVDARPTTLTNNHKYNLRNQGWDPDIVSTCGTDAIECTLTNIEVYPSNSDTWSLGKIADVTSADIDKYDPETLKRNSVDIGRAPRGHYIIDLYDRGVSRQNVSGITVTNADRESGLVSTAAAYAGRIFYSGINSNVLGGDRFSPNLSGAVLFSQVVQNDFDVGKCYQEGDPTSPTNSDLVDTDGGIIIVSGAINIVSIKAIKTSLFVFAENGVWQIRGDEGGFRATSFQVNKISSIGVFSRESIVEANGTVYFWGENGIFSLTPNQFDSTTYDTNNITLTTIQKGYNSLPNLIKQTAKGFFDASNNTIRWLYKSDDAKVLGEPIDIQPTVPTVGFSSPVTVDATGSEPKVARLSNTQAVVIYKKGASTDIFYRILTLNADLSVTSDSENTLVAASPSTITGYDIIGLTDNKVITVYTTSANDTFCTVGNLSGSTLTFDSPTNVSTDFRPVLVTSQMRIGKISSSRVVIVGRYVTSFRPGAMVIDISASDVITNGTIAFSSAATSISNPNIAILTASKFVLSWNGTSTNEMEVATISGTSITFDGTKYAFPNATQFPSASSRANLNVAIKGNSSSTLIAIGEGTIVDGGVTTHAPILYTVSESSGVLTSTTALQDTDHNNSTTASTTRYFTVNTENGNNIAVAHSSALSPNEAWVTKYSGGTPAQVYDLDINTYSGSDSGRHPSITHLTNGRYILTVWESISGSTLRSYGVSAL